MTWLRFIRIVLAFGLLAVPAYAQALSLTGTVTYRERIALPPGAQLHVSLVTLPGNVPVAGASARIPAKGQVPLLFSLNLRDGVIRPERRYGLVAEIQSGGYAIFANAHPIAVDPSSGTDTAILVQATRRPLADPMPTPPSDLVDIQWTVTSIAARPVSGSPITLSIATDQRAGGHGGCNDYFTEAVVTDKAISFGPAAATRMACAPEIMAQEHAYFAALAAVTSYERSGDGLRLLDAAGVPLVGLVRAKE